MNLPKKCPECGIDLENESQYYALGIQYCNGMVLSIQKEKDVEPMLELDLEHTGGDWSVDPYEVRCGECEHVLWQRHIIVNEEQFFVGEKDAKRSGN